MQDQTCRWSTRRDEFFTTTPPMMTMPLITSRFSTGGGGCGVRVLSSTPPIRGTTRITTVQSSGTLMSIPPQMANTSMTASVPGAIEVISHLAKSLPEMVVGAGTVLDAEMASRCLDAGAMFLTSTGLVPEVVEFALKNDVLVFPGAMTPTTRVWDALCRHIDGMAIGTTIAALHERGALAMLAARDRTDFGPLREKLAANAGFLHVAMRLLAEVAPAAGANRIAPFPVAPRQIAARRR